MKNKMWMLLLCGVLIAASPMEAKRKKKKEEKPVAVQPPKPDLTRPGLFTVTKKGTDWFFEIPDSLIGCRFLTTVRYTATPAGCGAYGGEMINQQTVFWEMGANKQLLLRAEFLINTSDTAQMINRALLLSSESPILGSFPVESHAGGLYKIKVTSFFNEDSQAFGMPANVKKQFGLAGLIGSQSYVEDIKSFPLNTEVRLVKTWNASAGRVPSASTTGKATFGLNISFLLLPEQPMRPRLYDPRIGYFAVQYNYLSDSQQHVEQVRPIVRWRLEPKDEDVEKMKRGELVEPRKPIVFYIDPATPVKWRKYLIQGVNDWQVAFEKAGFKNAIIGKEWPENDSVMSLDDARFSVIRYLASPVANAYGPCVRDPRSGEILESHIFWHHNIMSLLHDWYMVQAGNVDEAARKMNFDDELMGQLVRFVSSHEVGHALGLRHNFGASSTVPVDSLRDRRWVERYGHTPSIMDYARFNYVAQPEDSISRAGLFPRINDYDLWAIEWGYRPVWDAVDAESDRRALEPLVTERLAGNPRLWFGNGESNAVSDPRCQTEDLGDDAVKASEYGIRNLKRMVHELPAWTCDSADWYNQDLKNMYGQVRMQLIRYNGHVIRNIGGYFNDFKTVTETGSVYTPVPLSRQKAAMDYVRRLILSEPEWLTDVPYLDRISWDPQTYTMSVGLTAMSQLLGVLGRLNKEYPASAYLNDLITSLFSETVSGRVVSRYRMALQSAFVDGILSTYKSARITSELRPPVLAALRVLKTRTATGARNGADATSKAHFASLNDVITKALDDNQ